MHSSSQKCKYQRIGCIYIYIYLLKVLYILLTKDRGFVLPEMIHFQEVTTKYMGELMENRGTVVGSGYANSSQCQLSISGSKDDSRGSTFTKGNLCPDFRQIRGG